ncbi:MAG TPA: TonB-dependent receptor [Vicinamibacterales bacterium]|nr:TonB-dependent receptor [Vicinamibacterales bacterium]
MARSRKWALFLMVLVSLTWSLPGLAQEFRGSIVGKITDSTGGVLPGVTVTVSNNDTKVAQTLVTDGQGVFSARFLNVGTYTVTASLQGFKKISQPAARVTVGDTIRVDFTLEPGGMTETVEVRAETTKLNTTTGISGVTVDAKQIAQLPLGDGTAYMLTRLAPGIMDSSDLHFARPMDNGNLGGIVANGVQGGNEFSIDGAPNLSNAKGVGFSPPSGAIAQFKVQTNAFDAQTGHTAGAVVNLALKSGTNSISGEGGYYNRDASRTKTPLLTERQNGTKPTRTYNRWVGTLTGPIAANRTFFMVSAEHLRDVQPEPSTFTVPTMKMRNGDFSEFTNAVYDPFSAANVGGTITRQPFLNNVIPPGLINPVAAKYASMYPEPNRPGTASNYFTNMLRPYDYNAFLARIDHNFSSDNRIFANGYYNKRREDRYNWALGSSNIPDGKVNGFPVTQGYDYRSNLGLTGGWTNVLTRSTVLDVRMSRTKFGEYRDPAGNFDLSTMGFSPTALQLMAGKSILPMMTFGTFSTTNQNSTIATLGTQRSDWGEGFNRPMVTWSLAPTVSMLWKEHSLKAGYDLRYQNWVIESSGYPIGRYHFNGFFTRQTNGAGLNDRAQSWAQFLLGLPTATTGAVATPGTVSSQFEIASPGEWSQRSHALFLQDDWRVSQRLTLNLGARVEINGGMSETANRNLAGFDTTSASPIEAAAKTAYTASPIPQLAATDFKVKGGLLFADGPVNNTKSKILPRAAASYLLNKRTVLRGGVGLFSFDYFFENINQAGFSQATPINVSNDNGLTFNGATLSNPIPGGSLTQPVGNAAGLMSQVSQNLGTLYQSDREVPYYTRWEMSVQHELPDGWMVAFTYLGSRGSNLPVVQAINNIPMAFLSTGRTRDAALETLLSQNVTNPFVGLMPGTSFNNATIARNQLLRPFPQFGTISLEKYDGTDRYDAATIQVDKRFRGGNSLTVQYTRSNTRDKLNYLNPADGILEDRISPNDRPNRLSIGTSLQLPIGRDGLWGKEMAPALDAILGGWRLSGTYQYQSGFPLVFGSVYYDSTCGDPKSLKSFIGRKDGNSIAGLDAPGWDINCFYFHDAAVQTNGVDDIVKQRADSRINMATANTVRYFPSTLPGVRTHQLHLFDFGISKAMTLPRGMTMQIRIELINALNYTVLWNPGVDPRANSGLFGIINQDRNNPRDIQLGVRFTF